MQNWEAVMAKSALCLVGVHRWGSVEIDDEGQKRTCARCHDTRYLPVGPTGPAGTYGEQQPPQGG